MTRHRVSVAWLVMGLLAAAGPPVCAWAQDEPASEPAGELVEEAPPRQTDGGVTGLVSIDFKDADIRQVLRVISLKSGVDIVAGTDVEGLVTIKLTNVPWEQALDIILRTYAFTYERKDNVVRVMTLDALEQEALSTEVFLLDYATAKDVPDVIQEMLSDRGRVKFDERTNTVIVTDVPSTLFQIKEVIDRLDQRTPQVLIEARIVETKLEKEENLGIDWSQDLVTLTQTATAFGSSFPFPADSTLGQIGNRFLASPVTKSNTVTLGTLTGPALTLTLNALKRRKNTKIISNPTLTVLNNQTAQIHIGEEYPIPTFSVDPSTGRTVVSGFETRTVGTVLTVSPHVNPSQEIVVDLKPEITEFTSNAEFNTGGDTVSLPKFSSQIVTTQVRIADGNTIAIGGLVKEKKVIQVDKVPFLGDIPIIGLLFTNKREFDGSSAPASQQDLLIFLTVNLEKDRAPTQAVASAVSE